MANIMVKMPDVSGGVEREVFVEIDGPEIHVVARDKTTGENYDASLDFMYDN